MCMRQCALDPERSTRGAVTAAATDGPLTAGGSRLAISLMDPSRPRRAAENNATNAWSAPGTTHPPNNSVMVLCGKVPAFPARARSVGSLTPAACNAVTAACRAGRGSPREARPAARPPSPRLPHWMGLGWPQGATPGGPRGTPSRDGAAADVAFATPPCELLLPARPSPPTGWPDVVEEGPFGGQGADAFQQELAFTNAILD